jgi:uncharacterized membrane protein YdjX (TVP38/TMEM64 family)
MNSTPDIMLHEFNKTVSDSKPFWRPALGRGIVVLAVIAVGAGIVYFTPLKEYWHNVRKAVDAIHGAGAYGAAIFIIAAAIGMLIGCPRIAVCGIGGMAFGFWEGLIFSQAATLLGAWLTFVLVRWCGRDFIERHWPKAYRLSEKIQNRGVTTVLLLRQLPIHTMAVNITLGLTRLRHRDFLIGTLLGTLPESIPFTLLGTGIVSESASRSVSYIIGSAVLLVAVGTLLARYAGSRLKPALPDNVTEINPTLTQE